MGASLGDVEVLGGAIGDRVVFDASEDWNVLTMMPTDKPTSSYQRSIFYKENGSNLEFTGGVYASIAFWSLVFAIPFKYQGKNWKVDTINSSIFMPWGNGFGGNNRGQLIYSQEKGGIIMGAADSSEYGQYQYVIVFHLVLVPVS